MSLSTLVRSGAWLVGLLLAALLTTVVRPLAVGPLLWMTPPLRTGERLFVPWSGLKGAAPVIVQGALVPTVAARLSVPMREVEPRPWVVGLRDQPQGASRYRVTAGAPADG